MNEILFSQWVYGPSAEKLEVGEGEGVEGGNEVGDLTIGDGTTVEDGARMDIRITSKLILRIVQITQTWYYMKPEKIVSTNKGRG